MTEFPRIIQPDTEEFREAKETSENLSTKFAEEGLEVLKQLEEEVLEMKLASRFSSITPINSEATSGNFNPALKDLPEADFKREQLLNDIQAIRNELLAAAARVESVVMDIKATQAE